MSKQYPGDLGWRSKGYLFFCGICMGAADLIPGISGGTIAFIMGFYSQLLESIKTINLSTLQLLFSGRLHLFFQKIAWKFLLILGSGILFSFIAFAGFLHFVLEHEVYRIYFYSIFFGLILASFWFCMGQVRQWKWFPLVGLFAGALIAYYYTGPFRQELKGSYAIKLEVNQNNPLVSNYDRERQLLNSLTEKELGVLLAKEIVSAQTEVYNRQGERIGIVQDFVTAESGYRIDIWLMFCGAIAVCALLLPGISGSYILTLFGVYPLVIGALAELVQSMKAFSFDRDAFFILLSLGIGILVGLLIFSRFVSWLLKCYHDFTVATLSGFMMGSIGSVWPFWNYVYYLNPLKIYKGPQLLLLEPIFPSLVSPVFALSLGCILIGFCLVVGTVRIGKDLNTN